MNINGDLVCIRDEHALVGVGVIRSITSESSLKERFSCPVTKITGIKENEVPALRCNDKHEFETPLSETIEVTNCR